VGLVELPKNVVDCKNLVGGVWLAPEGVAWQDVRSPYSGEVIGRVPLSSAADVAAVVEAAKAAAPGWRQTALRERTARMFQFRLLLEKHVERLAHLAASEAGKTVGEARAEVHKGMEVLDFALSIQNLDTGGSMEVSAGVFCEYRREPLGVVAGITPFNFPAMVPMWMFPIAVTLGNAFILKPSEKVPLTACALGELMLEAGVPPGVFSIVHGNAPAVEALLQSPDIAAVAFVGSSTVARKVYELGTTHGKRVLALGGAKNHLIVTPDADPTMTAQAVLDSFTGCAGQRCMAASVMVAVGDVQHIIDEVARKARALQLGTQMGAIIERKAVERLHSAIGRAEKDGAKLLVDGRGRRPDDAEYTDGNWLGPTILDGVKPEQEAAQRELFGPVLTIVRVPTLSAAIAVENASPYGNAASVFTQSGVVAQQVAEHARAGMIGVNVGVPVPREPFSFGGIGESKFGHGDITGPSSLDFWSLTKKITRKWSGRASDSWMS